MSKLQSLGINFWIYASIILFIIVLIQFILSMIPVKKKPSELKDNDSDMGELMHGIWNAEKAKKLYKVLRTVHPDTFPQDEEKKRIATELSALITTNQYNYSKLKELKLRAEKELNMTFKWVD